MDETANSLEVRACENPHADHGEEEAEDCNSPVPLRPLLVVNHEPPNIEVDKICTYPAVRLLNSDTVKDLLLLFQPLSRHLPLPFSSRPFAGRPSAPVFHQCSFALLVDPILSV